MVFEKVLPTLRDGGTLIRKAWPDGLKVTLSNPGRYSATGDWVRGYVGPESINGRYMSIVSAGGTSNPWVPSQTDLFADDWIILNA